MRREDMDGAVGRAAFGSDGRRLGDVIALREDGFVVEKGIAFPADFIIGYDEVTSVERDGLHLALEGSYYLARAASQAGSKSLADRPASEPSPQGTPGQRP